MIKSTVAFFLIALSFVSCNLASLSLNYDDMSVYPLSPEDLNISSVNPDSEIFVEQPLS